MLVLRHLGSIGRRFQQPVLTLGNFDGVHRGHQEILGRLVQRAREIGGTSIALTFHPHPAQLLSPNQAPLLLTDWRSKLERLAAGSVDVVITERFTREFSEIDAEEFVRRLLIDGLGVRQIVVGHRVRFGHGRRGNSDVLRVLGERSGVEVEIIGPVVVQGIAVSSSAVRQAVNEGDLEKAAVLLGRRPSAAARVVHGHHRGHSLGFPTANLRISGLMLPPDGVYAVRARRRNRWLHGVANLGFNPTFDNNERSLEVHLFDFSESIYAERLEVEFVQKLRGERKFPSPKDLVAQIRQDADQARGVLAKLGGLSCKRNGS
ncbi:MAG: bifunctional riboflavin kinase/FAD synthetase [Deltaproteobacteria bacterium]|nr:bifunctional riboflavin kinase/FAD synthetase [Deltaproteobacteria bacterium]